MQASRGTLPSPHQTWGTARALQSLRGAAVKEAGPPWLAIAAFLAQVPPRRASILGAVSRSLPQVRLPRPPYWFPWGDFALIQYFSTASLPPLFTPNTHASPENSERVVLGVPSALR